jgi:hypothetical protein
VVRKTTRLLAITDVRAAARPPQLRLGWRLPLMRARFDVMLAHSSRAQAGPRVQPESAAVLSGRLAIPGPLNDRQAARPALPLITFHRSLCMSMSETIREMSLSCVTRQWAPSPVARTARCEGTRVDGSLRCISAVANPLNLSTAHTTLARGVATRASSSNPRNAGT